MKVKLNGGFGAARNIVPVVASDTSNQNLILGEMHMLRRSGWRGGPTYQFHPNEHGEALGLKATVGKSVRQILKELTSSVSPITKAMSPDVARYQW